MINASLIAVALLICTFDGTIPRLFGVVFLIAYLYFYFSNPALFFRRLLATVVTLKLSVWLGAINALSGVTTGNLLLFVQKIVVLLESFVVNDTWFILIFFGLLIASIFEMAFVNGLLSDKGVFSLFVKRQLVVTSTMSNSWKYNSSAKDKNGNNVVSFALTLRLKNADTQVAHGLVSDDIAFFTNFSGLFWTSDMEYTIAPRLGSRIQQDLVVPASEEGDVDVLIYIQNSLLRRFLKCWKPSSLMIYFVLKDSMNNSHRIAHKCLITQ
ncbi:hypothetical protein [Rheinheimera soli]|uniref:hypothetical protein n=1 Tax=Rheinheimera soli TaxID=443616 RepID=UPI001E5842D9|nr:hypothetical protein [Rheinheimera soli]